MGMHSPWGIIDQMCEKKGWTLQYVLEGITWANIQMMTADKIHLVKSSDIVHKVNKDSIKEHRERFNNG